MQEIALRGRRPDNGVFYTLHGGALLLLALHAIVESGDEHQSITQGRGGMWNWSMCSLSVH